MCDGCYEQIFSEVMVKEMRNGLYHIDLHLYPPGEIGIFREIIQLPGSHSDRRYKIIYNDECYLLRNCYVAFMLTVEEMPSISGSEMSTVNSSLIDDQEKPQTKSQKFGETSFLSEDLEAEPSCPVQVWIKTNYEKAASSKSSMLPMVKYGSNKWRMEVTNPRDPDNRYYSIYPCSITILIDLGTPVRERNVIMMSDGLAEMFYNQHLCDVHFDFKDSQTVGAHVVILSAGSPVFSAMFRSQFLESKTKKVTIVDIDIEVFRQLLIYLYTGSAPKLAEENMTQLLFVAADKYNIDNLKTECTDALLKHVNLDNAIRLLVWSHIHSVAKLKEATLKFLAANSLEICSQPEWIHLIKNYPKLCLLATQHMSKLLNKTNKTAKST
jgi:DNA-binding transcriptional regulator/RsmH inhibitor MraZ